MPLKRRPKSFKVGCTKPHHCEVRSRRGHRLPRRMKGEGVTPSAKHKARVSPPSHPEEEMAHDLEARSEQEDKVGIDDRQRFSTHPHPPSFSRLRLREPPTPAPSSKEHPNLPRSTFYTVAGKEAGPHLCFVLRTRGSL